MKDNAFKYQWVLALIVFGLVFSYSSVYADKPDNVPHPVFSQPPAGLELIKEPFIKEGFSKGEEAINWYLNEVKHRHKLEKSGQEYLAPYLSKTLDNSRLLINRILADEHFTTPLNENEREVYQLLARDVDDLLRASVPYKRTVVLTAKLMSIYDLTLSKRVDRNELDGQKQTSIKYQWSGPSEQELYFEDWHGLAKPKEDSNSFNSDSFNSNSFNVRLSSLNGGHFFKELLNNQSVIFFPSFEPLDLDDFVQMSHIPFFPLGMTTEYSLQVHNIMAGPLEFYCHDIFHSQYNFKDEFRHRPYKRFFQQTLMLKQALLDLPAPHLQRHGHLTEAVVMILFEAMHEDESLKEWSENKFGNQSKILNVLSENITERKKMFSPRYQALTETDIRLAALWVSTVFNTLDTVKGRVRALPSQERIEYIYSHVFLPAANTARLLPDKM